MKEDRRILSLALEALYVERQKIDAEIATLQARLGPDIEVKGRANNYAAKRRISAAGLKAIAAAQRKRWAKARALKARKR